MIRRPRLSGGWPGSRSGRKPPGRGRSRVAMRRTVRVRRLAAAASVGLATWVAVGAVLPSAPSGVPVLVAARDLDAGAAVRADDLRTQSVDPAMAGAGGLADPAVAVGQRLATPLAAGEPVTASRLVPAGPLAHLGAGSRAVHVPVADAGVVGLLHAGDRVDVIRALDGARIATDLVVLAVDARPESDRWDVGTAAGSGVLLAVPASTVGVVVQAAVGTGQPGGVHLVIRQRG